MNNFNFLKFKNEGEYFFSNLLKQITNIGIDVNSLPCDHLCFRTSTFDEYISYKKSLLEYGTLLTEANINGRPISTIKLNTPFKIDKREIYLIEIPSPKPNKSYNSGFEHAEFVLQESFEEFKLKHSSINFNEGGDKILNPELFLKFNNETQVKFHYLDLSRVIEIEETNITDIIFDLDGTIIQSRENIYKVNQIIFSKILGREISHTEVVDKFYPEFSKLCDLFGVNDNNKRREVVDMWSRVSMDFNYPLFPGIFDLLNSLRDKNINIHLWTARDELSSLKILNENKITKYFKTMSFAFSESSKPNAKNLCLDLNKIEKNSYMLIGDSSSDMIGAKNINAIAAAAIWDKHANLSNLIKNGAEIFLKDPTELKNWIIK